MPRYVLGANAGPHDNSAALLRDGELVAMVEEERLSRNVRAIGEPPRRAIAACLAEAGIELDVVEEISVGWDVPAMAEIEGVPFREAEFAEWLLGGGAAGAPPLRFVNHHLAHAASAFHTSGMSEAAVLVVDGRGESVATTIFAADPRAIEPIAAWGIDQSLGHLYGCASAWAGLTIWGAGKLMGLAAYGDPRQPVPLHRTPDGYAIHGAPDRGSPISSHLQGLRRSLVAHFDACNFPFGWGSPAEPMAHADFAASIQRAVEEAVLSLAERARRETGFANLAIAGGVGLNCAATGSLIRAGVFDEVWVPPFPHDAGVSLGAALVADRARSGRSASSPRLPHAFWAPTPQDVDGDLLADLGGCELDEHAGPQLAESVARHLDEGRTVGWWQGRAEVGQRALGARSILCDPRRRSALVRVNSLKKREAWRPLAPAVLADREGEMFDGALPAAADFMLAALPVKDSARPRLPAAVHVDGSARPQAVHPSQARYHETISAFRERTGVPAVINTSFNLAGEPIVQSARDAVETFLASQLDVLVLGDLVACKPQATASEEKRTPQSWGPRFFVPWSCADPDRARARQ